MQPYKILIIYLFILSKPGLSILEAPRKAEPKPGLLSPHITKRRRINLSALGKEAVLYSTGDLSSNLAAGNMPLATYFDTVDLTWSWI